MVFHQLLMMRKANQKSSYTKFEERWAKRDCYKAETLQLARKEFFGDEIKLPEHSESAKLRWIHAFGKQQTLFLPTVLSVDNGTVAIFRFSLAAYGKLFRDRKNALAAGAHPDLLAASKQAVQANAAALSVFAATGIQADGYELLVFRKDLSAQPRSACEGNILTHPNPVAEFAELQAICRKLRPDRVAFVRILPHARIPAFPILDVEAGPGIAFYHVHLVPRNGYKQGLCDLIL
jgi:hypothetical protein